MSLRTRTSLVAATVAIVAWPARARAWDPATTHAGLTERAVEASQLHAILARRYSRPLGSLEPLAWHPELLPLTRRMDFSERLIALDPAGGFSPDARGVQAARSWVIAGAVMAKTPPERGRHHFLDPTSGRGLHDQGALAEMGQILRSALDGGASLRRLATGTAFNLTGRPSVDWVSAPENDLGLPALDDALERATAGATPEAREGALADALMALGGLLSILEDAGEPAHVRNDYVVAFLGNGGGPFNHAEAFERFSAAAYGRSGVPAASAPVARPTLRAYFTAADGLGLADRTNRRFFSPGTLPSDGIVDHDTTTLEVVKEARASLAYPLPWIPHLDLKDIGRKRYLTVEGRKTLAYRRVPGRVRFFLDRAVYADAARALLPEIGAYAAGLLDHLLRGEITLHADGASVEVSLPEGTWRGRLRVLAEDAQGRRVEIRAADVETTSGGPLATLAVPAGTARIAAVFRGEDAGGPLVAAGELRWQPAP